MTKSDETTRRDFMKQVAAGAVAAAGTVGAEQALGASRQAQSTPRGRVIGANDRINVGFVGCGGRMNTHIRRIMERNKERGDVQAVAVNDIWDKRKQRAREATGVEERSVHHDYRELCARSDVDVVVISSPDHWHHPHAMEALRNGKDVYLEKPMTYTVDEAREIVDAVQAGKRVLQVGSQYTSMDHFWKARKAIQDGLLGEVVWASGGFGRNRNQRGEWNYAIDPEATDKTLDWKAFLGSAPKRPFEPERYFRWRKYWDYSGGIATDLFYHVVAPLNICWGEAQFPHKVMASGGIYIFNKDGREVPDTFHLIAEFSKGHSLVLSSSMANGQHIPGLIRGHEGTIVMVPGGQFESRVQHITVTPENIVKKAFVEKWGKDAVEIPTEKREDHMENFLRCVKTREKTVLDALTAFKAMTTIGMAVQSYREGRSLYFNEATQRVTDKPTEIMQARS
jgi:predicted dehydrogenase